VNRTLQSMGTGAAGDDAVSRKVAELAPWFHNLHLPSGHQTAPDHPLGDFPAFKWEQVAPHVPRDLSGARALDIGCNAGFYSFQLAARGASVLAIDSDDGYLAQGRWAAEQLDPDRRVEFRRMQVYGVADLDERFDLILFMGVLYHLRHPLLALDAVCERLDGLMVFQTLTMPGAEPVEPPDDLLFEERARLAEPGWPKMAFVERSLAGDPTNWWVADDACVRAMLASSGVRVVATPGHEIYLCEGDEGAPGAPGRRAELRAARGTG
jgi:tRNA (mo5U34)-methyltransferase